MGESCAGETAGSTRWGIVSSQIIHTPQLSICARMVYTSMTTRAQTDGQVEFCQLTMAKDLGMSRAWVNAGAQELERAGLILVYRVFLDGLQRPSRYTLLDGLRTQKAARSDSDVMDGQRRGAHGDLSEPVGKTTSSHAERPTDHGNEDTASQCQSATGGTDQPVAVRCQPADTCHQPADTSHESQIYTTLSEMRERASPLRDLESDLTISLDWKPSQADRAWALGLRPRLDIDAFTDCFVLTCRAKNYRYTDASAAWRLWIRDPKKPLPTLELTEPTNLSGDSDHAPGRNAHRPDRNDSNGIRFSDAGQRKIFRDDGGARRKTFSGGSGPNPADLRALNASRASACLGGILARRGVYPSA
jgi:hypothetical protein